MSFERKLSKEAYFIFKMTASTAQFGLLVSALTHRQLLNLSVFIYKIKLQWNKQGKSASLSLKSWTEQENVFGKIHIYKLRI